MALTYGFYNSLNGDRKYDAVQMSQIFDGIINDGIFMSIGDRLMVTANEGLSVTVGTGRAWFNGTWTRNDAPYILNLEPANLLLKRIDAVVLEINASDDTRENSIKIITGTPSSEPVKPELIRTDKVNQYPLAYISVDIGATAITQANIENAVGLDSCPFVTGILETMDIDVLVAQWESQWENWMADMVQSAEEFKANQENDFVEWSTQRRTEFDEWKNEVITETESFQETQKDIFIEWFENLQYQLSGDVAGNLQTQIDNMKGYVLDYTMEASKWSDDIYPFEEEFPFEEFDIEIEVSDRCNVDQLDSWGNARIVGSKTTNNCKAYGFVPTVDIPIILKVVVK